MFNHFKPTPKAPDAVAPRRYVRYNCGSGSVITSPDTIAEEVKPLPEITAIEVIESEIRDMITTVSTSENETGMRLTTRKSYVIPICLTDIGIRSKQKAHQPDHHPKPGILAIFTTKNDTVLKTTFVRCRGGPVQFNN